MKPLTERYRAYCDKHKAKIDQKLAEAGLPHIGLNALAYYGRWATPPMSFEEYAAYSDQTMSDLAEIGFKTSKAQSKRAKKPRGKVSDDGKTVSQIIGWLATAEDHEEETAKDLWNLFLGQLGELLLNPNEIPHPSGDFRKLKCEYEIKNEIKKSLTFGEFANVVSAFRTGKKKSR